MPKFKVLKSVAHNLGHSFTSLMNYADDDYAMGHILRFARETGRDTLQINLVTGEASPQALLANPIAELPARYSRFFRDLVKRQGSDPSLVTCATLVLHYDLKVERPLRGMDHTESPYVCDVRITDTRGKIYNAHFDGWWYPERLTILLRQSKPWWKFWER
jgi:hypothetical protein